MASGGHIHEAVQGESLHSLAVAAGHRWETLWDHPENAELRSRRKSPDILLPGDSVFIPAIEPGSASAPTDRRTRFRRHSVPAKLCLVFHDLQQPHADAAFVMEIDGQVETGTTDASGMIERWVSPFAKRVRVRFLADLTGTIHEFALRRLDPHDSESGALQRLRQLGYAVAGLLTIEDEDPALVEALRDKQLRACLRLFQADAGLEVTELLDAATMSALERGHGS